MSIRHPSSPIFYNYVKLRSTTSHCYNQKPIVEVGDACALATSSPTAFHGMGELELGQCRRGVQHGRIQFEDSILITSAW
jgi:hypothetical protein